MMWQKLCHQKHGRLPLPLMLPNSRNLYLLLKTLLLNRLNRNATPQLLENYKCRVRKNRKIFLYSIFVRFIFLNDSLIFMCKIYAFPSVLSRTLDFRTCWIHCENTSAGRWRERGEDDMRIWRVNITVGHLKHRHPQGWIFGDRDRGWQWKVGQYGRWVDICDKEKRFNGSFFIKWF